MPDEVRVLDRPIPAGNLRIEVTPQSFPGARTWLFCAWLAFLCFTLGTSYRHDTQERMAAADKMLTASESLRRTICSATPEAEMHKELRDTCYPAEYN